MQNLLRNAVLAIASTCVGLCAAAARAELKDFKHPLDGAPIEFKLKPGEAETDALKSFKATGVNGYRNDKAAIAAGHDLYDQWCASCHNSDASGRLGPPLIGEHHVYDQTATDPGMFAIIYAGASGAMQPFSLREITQDEMLKIIAYVRTLDKK